MSKAKPAIAKPGKPEETEPEVPTSGSGRFFFENGATYEGEWKLLIEKSQDENQDPKAKAPAKDKKADAAAPPPVQAPPVRHGKGVYTEQSYSYDGEWQDDKMHGQGKFTYASGSVYMGAWENNMYHGAGRYEWPDGRTYQGAWECNRMHGQGVYTDASGHQWTGQFYNGAGPGLTSIQ